MICRRIVFRKPGVVAVEEAEVPKPGPGQVLVKTLVTLISTGTELTLLSGRFPKGSVWDRIKYPFLPGYSNCGVVVETGPGVKEFKPGERVVSQAPHSEYATVNVKRVYKVPEKVPEEEAVFAVLAAIVMNGVRLARIALGECVAVVGMGLLGQLACQFSRLCGGFPVIAIDLSDKRLEVARKLGAMATVNPRKDDVKRAVFEYSKGRGADVVFEVTGNPEVIPWELDLLRRQGRLIVLSSPRGPTKLDFHDYVNWPSRVIIGAHASSHPEFETPYNPWTFRRNVELFFDLLVEGVVNVRDLVSEIHPWTEAETVYRRLLDPLGERLQTLGVLLDFR